MGIALTGTTDRVRTTAAGAGISDLKSERARRRRRRRRGHGRPRSATGRVRAAGGTRRRHPDHRASHQIVGLEHRQDRGRPARRRGRDRVAARRAAGHRRAARPAAARSRLIHLRRLLRQRQIRPVLGEVLPAACHLPLQVLIPDS
ncbi:hypothetical protein ACU4GD_27860 [Cupriavidus basilensis]